MKTENLGRKLVGSGRRTFGFEDGAFCGVSRIVCISRKKGINLEQDGRSGNR